MGIFHMQYQIYGRDNCKYCVSAEGLLTFKKIPFQTFKLGRDFTREELIEMFPSAKTFPQITQDGVYIGGYEDLVKHLS